MEQDKNVQAYEELAKLVKEDFTGATAAEKEALGQVAAGIRIGYALGKAQKNDEKESA